MRSVKSKTKVFMIVIMPRLENQEPSREIRSGRAHVCMTRLVAANGADIRGSEEDGSLPARQRQVGILPLQEPNHIDDVHSTLSRFDKVKHNKKKCQLTCKLCKIPIHYLFD